MIKHNIIESIRSLAKEKLGGDTSGHDWWHVQRVEKLAVEIAKKENADQFIVQCAALLHDVCDHKICKDQEECFEELKNLLHSFQLAEPIIEQIIFISKNVSFKGAKIADTKMPIEGKVVMDADRLDAMGAIGIARAFTYGGSRERTMYDPELKPVFHQSFEEYKNSQNTTVNHFYEKLLLLKERIHTETAKQMAMARHKYMEDFLIRFYNEWNGEA